LHCIYTDGNILVRKPIMKIAESTIQVQSSGIQSEAFFTVKQSNIGHIFGILRNQLYSNKPLAIIREYCTNAFDAHIDAGIPSRPIEVSFPTAFKNSLTIRDFGKGLSESEVYDIFVSYGESTKRGTNEQVGMLGLGSKSAFCYVNDFTITSYHNGTKSVYLAYIDETNIGKISKIAEEATSETGLAIDIVVKTIDLSQFRDVAGTFLAEFNPQPIVKNDDRVVDMLQREVEKSFIINTEEYAIHSWGYNQKSCVRMGNVNYPFHIDDLGLASDEYKSVECFRNLKVKLYAPIGSVVPSASRESLEMNTKTKQFIFDALKGIRSTVKGQIDERLSKCKSFYQFALEFDNTSQIRDVFNLVSVYGGKAYRPHTYNMQFIRKEYPAIKEIEEIRNDARSSFKSSSSLSIQEGQTLFAYYGNVPQNSIRQRIMNSGYSLKSGYLLRFASKADFDSLVNDAEWQGANFVDISNLIYTKVTGKSAGSFATSEVYSYCPHQLTLRNTWKSNTLSLQQSEGIYVEIKRFLPVAKHPNGTDIKTMEAFKELLGNAHSLGIKIDNLYGVKYCDIDKLGDGWIELTDYIQQALYNQTDDEIFKFNQYLISLNVSDEWEFAFNHNMADTDGDLTRLKEIVSEYYKSMSYISSQGTRVRYFKNLGYGLYLDIHDECIELVDKTLNKYPILRNLFGYSHKMSHYTESPTQKYWHIVNEYLKSQDYLKSEGLLD
jgi:hypothetical protein